MSKVVFYSFASNAIIPGFGQQIPAPSGKPPMQRLPVSQQLEQISRTSHPPFQGRRNGGGTCAPGSPSPPVSGSHPAAMSNNMKNDTPCHDSEKHLQWSVESQLDFGGGPGPGCTSAGLETELSLASPRYRAVQRTNDKLFADPGREHVWTTVDEVKGKPTRSGAYHRDEWIENREDPDKGKEQSYLLLGLLRAVSTSSASPSSLFPPGNATSLVIINFSTTCKTIFYVKLRSKYRISFLLFYFIVILTLKTHKII